MSKVPVAVDLARLESRLEELVRRAGLRAMADYRAGQRTSARVEWKGNSPVTSADFAVDQLVADDLARWAREGFAKLHYHSEERPEAWGKPTEGLTVVIDPIDGTRAFMEGRDDWCIALGVVAAGEPVLGLLHIPARGEMFAAHTGGGARHQGRPIRFPHEPQAPLRVSGPRGIVEIVAEEGGIALETRGSIAALAHRLVRPLAGDLDLALARPGAHDWDLVAAHAILNEAGGALLRPDGKPPVYDLAGHEHPALLAGSRGLLDRLMPSLLTGSLSTAKRG
ncbi:MAG: hypothetical protein CTY25_02995 [Methylobacterium sp.]|nr:MAG: hypothetical protein CTY25_02995 [Methylobacterium sp.]